MLPQTSMGAFWKLLSRQKQMWGQLTGTDMVLILWMLFIQIKSLLTRRLNSKIWGFFQLNVDLGTDKAEMPQEAISLRGADTNEGEVVSAALGFQNIPFLISNDVGCWRFGCIARWGLYTSRWVKPNSLGTKSNRAMEKIDANFSILCQHLESVAADKKHTRTAACQGVLTAITPLKFLKMPYVWYAQHNENFIPLFSVQEVDSAWSFAVFRQTNKNGKEWCRCEKNVGSFLCAA